MKKQLVGAFGEAKAAEYLRRNKYKIVALNYSCRYGEIDIIAMRKKVLCFVEVKLRKTGSFAQPLEHVTALKQQKIKTTAQIFIQEFDKDCDFRFDVIEVFAPQGIDTQNVEINHIEDAF